MEYRNIVSVSWGDHLIFGEGDGRLADSVALRRRMEHWREDLNLAKVHWRHLRTRLKGYFYAARGRKHPGLTYARSIDWDDFEVAPQVAHETGLKAYLYVSLFDEGWPLAPKKIRETSYHNAMHGQHVSWQSSFAANILNIMLWIARDRTVNGAYFAWHIPRFGLISASVF